MSDKQCRRSARTLIWNLAQHVRSAYIAERNNWNATRGGSADYRPLPELDKVKVRLPSKRPRSYWERIAEELLKNRVPNHREYVRAQFAARVGRGHPPTAQQLTGAAALRIWQTFCEGKPELVGELALAFAFQQQLYEAEVFNELEFFPTATDESIVRSVVMNDHTELTALFRYCVAQRRGFSDVARRFLDRAMAQYILCAKEYNAVWKDWIPDRFQDEARRLTQTALNQETRHG